MRIQTVKEKKIMLVSFVFFSFTSIMLGGAFAKIPEPDNIVYGVAGDGVVTVHLKINDVEICSYTMGDNPNAGVFYILRIPMDVDPLEPGAGYPGDRAYIYMNDDTETDYYIDLGERGCIHRLDLGTTNVDDDSLPDQWEQQIVDASTTDDIEHPSDVDPMADFDNDGFSNIRELLAGSHPVDTEEIPCCFGDMDTDSDVDGDDLSVFADEYPLGICECPSDTDGDGDVDDLDFFFFSEDMGRTDCLPR